MKVSPGKNRLYNRSQAAARGAACAMHRHLKGPVRGGGLGGQTAPGQGVRAQEKLMELHWLCWDTVSDLCK